MLAYVLQTRVLKEKQRELRETHTTGLSQIDMMNDLVKLLQVRAPGLPASAFPEHRLALFEGCMAS
jgi:hypothetical protein